MLSHFCCLQLFVTPWTGAHQAPLSMGILQARILEWVAMPFSRMKTVNLTYLMGSYVYYVCICILCILSPHVPDGLCFCSLKGYIYIFLIFVDFTSQETEYVCQVFFLKKQEKEKLTFYGEKFMVSVTGNYFATLCSRFTLFKSSLTFQMAIKLELQLIV